MSARFGYSPGMTLSAMSPMTATARRSCSRLTRCLRSATTAKTRRKLRITRCAALSPRPSNRPPQSCGATAALLETETLSEPEIERVKQEIVAVPALPSLADKPEVAPAASVS